MIFFENLEGEGGEERPPSEEDHRHDGEDQVTPYNILLDIPTHILTNNIIAISC